MNSIFMAEAIKEAKKASSKGNIPVGAVIVKDNQIIARAYNTKNTTNVATHHAEIIAIDKACKKLKTWRLNECIIYVTLEPCDMCYGAIKEARIKKVVYIVNSKYKTLMENREELIIETYKKDNSYLELLRDFFKDIR